MSAGGLATCPFPRCGYLPAGVYDLGVHLVEGRDDDAHRGVFEDLPARPAVPAPRAVPAGSTPKRVVLEVAAGQPSPVDRLGVDARVHRHVEVSGTELVTEMPCCPRDPFTKRAGRSVRVPVDGAADRVWWAPCQLHRLLWELVVDPEDYDEGWKARFDCVDTTAQVALSRTYNTAL
ncbi:hypothetical protein [Saccharothrix sp. HUAS TT1]|uniref:hypothetical protein n=1 Tax=unclassified Saccharothrix TaxID=2593673 RepID=UPI00345C552F